MCDTASSNDCPHSSHRGLKSEVTHKRQSCTAACLFVLLMRAVSAAAAMKQQPISALPMIVRVTVPPGPGWLGAGFGWVWLSKSGSGAVLRIDPATNRVLATIGAGVPAPGGDLWDADGVVWVSGEVVPIAMITPKTNELVRQFAGGKQDIRCGLDSAQCGWSKS
jgi:streptogramin lyase